MFETFDFRLACCWIVSSQFLVAEITKVTDSILKTVECTICLDTLDNAVSVGCGHFFCKKCITCVLKTKFKVPCPLCSKPFTKRSIQEASQRQEIAASVKALVDAVKDFSEGSQKDLPKDSTRVSEQHGDCHETSESHGSKKRKSSSTEVPRAELLGTTGYGKTEEQLPCSREKDQKYLTETAVCPLFSRRKKRRSTQSVSDREWKTSNSALTAINQESSLLEEVIHPCCPENFTSGCEIVDDEKLMAAVDTQKSYKRDLVAVEDSLNLLHKPNVHPIVTTKKACFVAPSDYGVDCIVKTRKTTLKSMLTKDDEVKENVTGNEFTTVSNKAPDIKENVVNSQQKRKFFKLSKSKIKTLHQAKGMDAYSAQNGTDIEGRVMEVSETQNINCNEESKFGSCTESVQVVEETAATSDSSELASADRCDEEETGHHTLLSAHTVNKNEISGSKLPCFQEGNKSDTDIIHNDILHLPSNMSSESSAVNPVSLTCFNECIGVGMEIELYAESSENMDMPSIQSKATSNVSENILANEIILDDVQQCIDSTSEPSHDEDEAYNKENYTTASKDQKFQSSTSICKSPGWSRIKQLNKDFHLRTFSLLNVQRNKSLTALNSDNSQGPSNKAYSTYGEFGEHNPSSERLTYASNNNSSTTDAKPNYEKTSTEITDQNRISSTLDSSNSRDTEVQNENVRTETEPDKNISIVNSSCGDNSQNGEASSKNLEVSGKNRNCREPVCENPIVYSSSESKGEIVNCAENSVNDCSKAETFSTPKRPENFQRLSTCKSVSSTTSLSPSGSEKFQVDPSDGKVDNSVPSFKLPDVEGNEMDLVSECSLKSFSELPRKPPGTEPVDEKVFPAVRGSAHESVSDVTSVPEKVISNEANKFISDSLAVGGSTGPFYQSVIHCSSTQTFECDALGCEADNNEHKSMQSKSFATGKCLQKVSKCIKQKILDSGKLTHTVHTHSGKFLKNTNHTLQKVSSEKSSATVMSASNLIESNLPNAVSFGTSDIRTSDLMPQPLQAAYNSSLHCEEYNFVHKGNSYGKYPEGTEKTKVIKRICLTLEEIESYFKDSTVLGKREICTVALPFSEYRLHLTVSDETLNVSVLRVIDSVSPDSSSLLDDISLHQQCCLVHPSPKLKCEAQTQFPEKNFEISRDFARPCSLMSPHSSESGSISHSGVDSGPLQIRSQEHLLNDHLPGISQELSCHNCAQENDLKHGSAYSSADSESAQEISKVIHHNKSFNNENQNSEQQTDGSNLELSFSAISSPKAGEFFCSAEDNSVQCSLSKQVEDTAINYEKQTDLETEITFNGNGKPDGKCQNTVNETECIVSSSQESNLLDTNFWPNLSVHPENSKDVNQGTHTAEDTAANTDPKPGLLGTELRSKSSKECSTVPASLGHISKEHANKDADNTSKKNVDTAADVLISEDIDPFGDTPEFCKKQITEEEREVDFEKIIQHSESYSADPDMMFAAELVAPLKDIAEKMETSFDSHQKVVGRLSSGKRKLSNVQSLKSDIRKTRNSIGKKSMVKKNKKFKRISQIQTSESSDCDETEAPTQPYPETERAQKKLSDCSFRDSGCGNYRSPITSEKSKKCISQLDDDDDETDASLRYLTDSSDIPTNVANKMKLELEEMNKKLEKLHQAIKQNQQSSSSTSDSESVGDRSDEDVNAEFRKPKLIHTTHSSNTPDYLSDDSKASSDLFAEQIPPTPPKRECQNRKDGLEAPNATPLYQF